MAAEKIFTDSFTFLPQGAIIQEFKVDGQNIVLGFPSAEPYKTSNSPFFGETIGRVANRISGAKINSLNGQSYPLAANNGPNTLHGGPSGWGKKKFEGPTPTNRNGKEAVHFKYISSDGDEGFPGTVELRVWYIAGVDKDDGVDKTSLEIEYEVELVGKEVNETVVAVTNHSYFNISAGEKITGTEVTMATNLHQVVDENAIPTGEISPFPGIPTPNTPFTLGEKEPDIDHCFVMNPDPTTVTLDTRSQPLNKLISFYHPETKLHLEALSTEPAFQFYTGKFINVTATEDGGTAKGARSGMCVEASRYVNAVNDERWKDMVLLKQGQIWGSRTVYRGWRA